MERPELHLFFPENDLALACNKANYTPPLAAIRLHRAGEVLPLWYGKDGDAFVSSGVNDAWFTRICYDFGIDMDVYNYQPELYQPFPWGWSQASRRYFKDLGFAIESMPTDEKLEGLRMLSHRRSAALLGGKLSEILPFEVAEPAVEIDDIDYLKSYIKEFAEPGLMLKLPWSSSGRGLLKINSCADDSLLRQAQGMINRQGSVTVEKFYDKLADFAMLFDFDSSGHCSYSGLSLFNTSATGAYSGNVLASDEILLRRLGEYYSTEKLAILASVLPEILEDIADGNFVGAMGVDMMIARKDTGGENLLVPAVEINWRMTMGHVASRFNKRFMLSDAVGLYSVTPKSMARKDVALPRIEDRKLVGGTLDLTPPNPDFVFRVSVDE